MVQVMSENNTWVSVCDTGFDDVDAKIICRNIGYKDGKAQCCSSLGQKLVNYNPIGNTHHYQLFHINYIDLARCLINVVYLTACAFIRS